MTQTILHLTPTDIEKDSRILKELKTLQKIEESKLFGFGIHLDDGWSQGNEKLKAEIYTFNLFSMTFTFLPRAILYFLKIIELTIIFSFRGIKLKPSITHCHDTMALPAGFIIKIFTGCKLIYDAHELESDKNGQNFILSKCTLLLEKLCWKRVDLFISVSDSIIDWYNKNLGLKRSILVLNSPILESSTNFSKKDQNTEKYFHKKYNISSEKPIFIYVGNLGKGRGIETILEAFKDKELNADIVFLGFGELSAKIKASSKSFSNIHLHDAVNHEKVCTLLRSADVGLCIIENVSLSDYYCLPNKLFEYIFSGLPVLASNFPEIIKVVDKYNLGLCSDTKPNLIKSCVKRIVKNPLKPIDDNLEELSWSAQDKRLINSYKQLLNI